jgi:hypothetical protein
MRYFMNALMYCYLIAPQLIGTTKVRCLKLLRIVRTDYDSEYLFQNVYYVPLEKKTFRDIRIEILNQAGDLIPFSDSQTHLKVVHFRRAITP